MLTYWWNLFKYWLSRLWEFKIFRVDDEEDVEASFQEEQLEDEFLQLELFGNFLEQFGNLLGIFLLLLFSIFVYHSFILRFSLVL